MEIVQNIEMQITRDITVGSSRGRERKWSPNRVEYDRIQMQGGPLCRSRDIARKIVPTSKMSRSGGSKCSPEVQEGDRRVSEGVESIFEVR